MDITVASLAAIFALLLAFTLVGPPIKTAGTRAMHNALGVTLPPAYVSLQQQNHPEGRRAQEVGEWRALWLMGIAGFGIPAAILSLLFVPAPQSYHPAMIVLIASMLGNVVFRRLTDGLDYVGHNIEIMVAEDDGWSGYREQEIGRMISRDRARTDMTPEQVSDKLDEWEWLALIVRRYLTY